MSIIGMDARQERFRSKDTKLTASCKQSSAILNLESAPRATQKNTNVKTSSFVTASLFNYPLNGSKRRKSILLYGLSAASFFLSKSTVAVSVASRLAASLQSAICKQQHNTCKRAHSARRDKGEEMNRVRRPLTKVRIKKFWRVVLNVRGLRNLDFSCYFSVYQTPDPGVWNR